MKRNGFFILLALAGEDRHGSGIMREVLDLTGGELRLWPATLYGMLEEMAGEGWIEALDELGRHPEGESERKRYYRITVAGRKALQAETRRLEDLVVVAKARTLGVRGHR